MMRKSNSWEIEMNNNGKGHGPIAIIVPNKETKNGERERLLKIYSRRIPALGIMLTIIAGIFFTSAKLLVKLLPNVSPLETVVIRSIFTAIVYFIPIVKNGYTIFGRNTQECLLIFGRGFFGAITFVFSYLALSYIPLGDSITIVLSSPVYTAIFAKLFLKERCQFYKVILIIFTMVGVALIAKPEFLFNWNHVELDVNRFIGIGLSLISSLTFAFTYIIIRKLHDTPVPTIIFTFATCSAIFAFIMMSIIGDIGHVAQTSKEFEAINVNNATPVCKQRYLNATISDNVSNVTTTISPMLISPNSTEFHEVDCGNILNHIVADVVGKHPSVQSQKKVLSTWMWPNDVKTISYILLISLFGILGELCLTSALHIELAGIVSLTRVSDQILAFIAQYLFLDEAIEWNSIAGSAIILSTITLTALMKILGYEQSHGH